MRRPSRGDRGRQWRRGSVVEAAASTRHTYLRCSDVDFCGGRVWFGCGGAAVWGRAVMRCRWVCGWSAYAFALVSTFAVSHNFWPSLGLQFANLGKARPLHQNCIRGRASLRKWQSDRAMGVPCAHCSLSREASPIYNEPPRRASPAHRRELQCLLAGTARARAGRRERSRRRRHGGQGSSQEDREEGR